MGGHGKERQQGSKASVKKKMRRRRSKRRRGAPFLPNKTNPNPNLLNIRLTLMHFVKLMGLTPFFPSSSPRVFIPAPPLWILYRLQTSSPFALLLVSFILMLFLLFYIFPPNLFLELLFMLIN